MESGMRVRKGEVIGRVGSTGQSTGPHLHYEVRKNGNHLNPADFY
jgi:murein DD-endopeptidase MepM/ murein hydrolase activator NlpD